MVNSIQKNYMAKLKIMCKIIYFINKQRNTDKYVRFWLIFIAVKWAQIQNIKFLIFKDIHIYMLEL